MQKKNHPHFSLITCIVDNAKTYFAVSEAIKFQIKYVMLSGQIDFNKSA